MSDDQSQESREVGQCDFEKESNSTAISLTTSVTVCDCHFEPKDQSEESRKVSLIVEPTPSQPSSADPSGQEAIALLSLTTLGLRWKMKCMSKGAHTHTHLHILVTAWRTNTFIHAHVHTLQY